MIIFKSINKLNKEVNFKANIGFVPTMGSLHKGHISLIHKSKRKCKKTLVSIFINPSQFNNKKDFRGYPKNIFKDIKILKKLKVDYLLIPRVEEMYKNKKSMKITGKCFQQKRMGNSLFQMCSQSTRDHSGHGKTIPNQTI